MILTRLLEYLGNQEGVVSPKKCFSQFVFLIIGWVYGSQSMKADSAVELTYYDSLSSEPYKDMVGSAAVDAVKEIYTGFSVSFRVHSRYKQQDGGVVVRI